MGTVDKNNHHSSVFTIHHLTFKLLTSIRRLWFESLFFLYPNTEFRLYRQFREEVKYIITKICTYVLGYMAPLHTSILKALLSVRIQSLTKEAEKVVPKKYV